MSNSIINYLPFKVIRNYNHLLYLWYCYFADEKTTVVETLVTQKQGKNLNISIFLFKDMMQSTADVLCTSSHIVTHIILLLMLVLF